MATEVKTSDLDFNIQETLERGSTELLNDLYSPETQTASPEELETIEKEVKPPAPPKPSPSKKTVEVIEKEEGEAPTGQEILSSFLNVGDDDEEEEAAEGKQDIPSPKEEKIPGSDNEIFSSLSKELENLGVFTKEEGEDITISTPEEFLERFQAEKQKGAVELLDNFIGKFGQDYKEAFVAIYQNGVDPKEYWGTYNEVVNFAELDLTQEENQIRVLKEALAAQRFEPEDIKDEIDRIRNYGDLETVARRHHKVLIKDQVQKLEQKGQKAKQDQEQKAALRSQFEQNVNTILSEKLKAKEYDGIPINTKLASELHDFLLVDKWRTPSGETLTDFDRAILDLKRPENHAMKIKWALLLKTLEKDPTLSTIQKLGVSKQSSGLFNEVRRAVAKPSVSQEKTPSSWFK
jgi:hypothetical protein